MLWICRKRAERFKHRSTPHSQSAKDVEKQELPMTATKKRDETIEGSSSISGGNQEETEDPQIDKEDDACCCLAGRITAAFGCIKRVITTIAYMALFKSLFSLGIFFYDFSSRCLDD